jgi:N-acyl-D-aspartate/D-glutamate deacylase
LKEIAEARATDPVVATMDLLSVDEVKVASFNQSESDIAHFMQRPWVVTSSDASLGHPRYYGSFARKYDTYVRDRKVIDLRTFIASSTIRPARIFGLKGRGELRAGAYADIVAFDPRRFRPRADYMHPTAFSTGVVAVLVNGKIAIEDGAATGMGSITSDGTITAPIVLIGDKRFTGTVTNVCWYSSATNLATFAYSNGVLRTVTKL